MKIFILRKIRVTIFELSKKKRSNPNLNVKVEDEPFEMIFSLKIGLIFQPWDELAVTSSFSLEMTLTLNRIGNGEIEIILRKTLEDRPVVQGLY